MSIYVDKDLSEKGVEVVFATPSFYDSRALAELCRGGDVWLYTLKMYDEVKKKLSAYCAMNKIKVGMMFYYGMTKGDFGKIDEGVGIICGENLANVVRSNSCDEFALYVKGDELHFKGYHNGIAEPEHFVIRELRMGENLPFLYNSVVNVRGDYKFVALNKATNSVGQLVKKALHWSFKK